MKQLDTIIKLIEGVYPRQDRNTSEKMRNLIHKDYGIWYDEQDIMKACGVIVEDWEELNNKVEWQ